MMSILKRIAALAAAVVMAACGGGGSDAGTSPFGGGGGGGGQTPVAVVGDLVVALSKSTVANTGSDSVIITTTALDAARSTIAGAAVQVAADADAIVSTSAATTGADGKLQSTLTIGANRATRVITVTVTSGAVTKTLSVSVFGAKLTGTVVPPIVEPGKPGKIQYRLVDQAGNPMADEDISVIATGLTPSTAKGKTDASGQYEFMFTAPGAPGSFTVTATAGGATTDPPQNVQVTAASSVPSVAVPITSASVSANPSVVGINAGSSTSNLSDIRALFLGDLNRPVANVRVKFDLAGDVNSIGGTFTTGTSTLLSDSNGVVIATYIPGARSSPTNGVTVRACYYTSDAAAAADPYDASGKVTTCSTSALVTMTVSAEPLGVSIGTNELIIVNELTYAKKFVVSVADSAGNALQDVNLVVSLDLLNFRKGEYLAGAGSWVKVSDFLCANEDRNRNGVLEVGATPALDEDKDHDGRLEPGKSDVTVSLLQTKTRADGTAELQILYAKSFGSWIDAKITVAASGVAGTEGRASWLLDPIPVDAASIKNLDVPPAYRKSPYGIVADCANPN